MLIPRFQKCGDGPVVFSFPFRRKETAGYLLAPAVKHDTLTADAFPAAGFVGAGAVYLVNRCLAVLFHAYILPQKPFALKKLLMLEV